MIPEIDLSGLQPVDDVSQSTRLSSGAERFLEQGVLLVRNAFAQEYIQRLHAEYQMRYAKYLVDESRRKMSDFHDAKGVGHKRIMIPLHLAGAFNDQQFYANQGLLPLLQYLLDDSMIMNSMGSVFSLPGAPDQHIHRDMANIYVTKTNRDAGEQWLRYPPPYAITVAIPLVPITELTGCTRIWPGTHTTTVRHDDPGLGDGEEFVCAIGSCILYDYRVLHAGAANRSDIIRPMLYCVYSRNWFRDAINYNKHKPLLVDEDEFLRVPKKYRHLFDWAVGESDIDMGETTQHIGRNALCYCNSGRKYKHCHGKLG